MQKKSTTDLSNLSLLRFFLAFWVFSAHVIPWIEFAGFNQLPESIATKVLKLTSVLQPNGSLHPAVIGFLVLSGFVISKGLPTGSNKSALKAWVVRRFFRIYPIYFCASIFGALMFILCKSALYQNLTGTSKIPRLLLFTKLFAINGLIPNGYPGSAFLGNAPLVTTSAEIILYGLYGLYIYKYKIY